MRGTKGPTGITRSTYDWNVQNGPGTTADRWARRVMGTAAWNSAIVCQIIVGTNTTLTQLQVVIYGTPLAVDSCTFTLRKNGVATGLTATLAAGATTANGTGSVSVVAGDYLTLVANQSGTEVQANWFVYIAVSD